MSATLHTSDNVIVGNISGHHFTKNLMKILAVAPFT